MRLKFLKLKSISTSATLPITASYPPEKLKQDGEIAGEDPIPLIIVEGFGGGAGNGLWGDFEGHLNAASQDGRKRKAHFVKSVLVALVFWWPLGWMLTCERLQGWTRQLVTRPCLRIVLYN